MIKGDNFFGRLLMKNNSFIRLGLAACIICATASCGKSSDEKAKTGAGGDKAVSTSEGKVVARVNGQSISQSQLDRSLMAMAQSQQQQNIPPQTRPAMEKEALKRLINLELLYQESQSKNLTPNDEEVTKAVTQIKSRLSNEESFQQLLSKSLSTEADFREEISRNLAIKRLIDQEILPTVEVTDEESNAFYQENKDKMSQAESARARHILVKLDKSASADDEAAAKQKIESIKKRIDDGEDFAEVAKTTSEGPSAKNGGDLGFFTRGRMVPEFEKAAFGLEKPGQVSEVIKTDFGFHIIKLEEKQAERTIPYEEAQKSISQHLKNQKMDVVIRGYVENLSRKAQVESQFDLGESPVKTP